MNYKKEMTVFIKNKYGITISKSEILEGYIDNQKAFIIPSYMINRIVRIDEVILVGEILSSFNSKEFKSVHYNNGAFYFIVNLKEYYTYIYIKLLDIFKREDDGYGLVWYKSYLYNNNYIKVFKNNIMRKNRVVVKSKITGGFNVEEEQCTIINNSKVIKLNEFNLPPYIINNINIISKDILDFCFEVSKNQEVHKGYLLIYQEDEIYSEIAKGVLKKLCYRDKMEVILIDRLKLRVILEGYFIISKQNNLINSSIDIQLVKYIEEYMNVYVKYDFNGIINVLFRMAGDIINKKSMCNEFKDIYCKIIVNTLELE